MSHPVDTSAILRGRGFFCLRFAKWAVERRSQRCFDPDRSVQQARRKGVGQVPKKQTKRTPRKVSCDECYFRVNLLCALQDPEPCATFRPAEAQLQPPPQLRLVFRQERRSRAAWAFPSAQEQAALYA